MSKAGRRHYRVAEREVEANTQCGCKDKHKVIAVVAVLLVATFIKGCVIGYLIGNKSE